MGYPEVLNFVTQLVKPGSAIVGLLLAFKFLHSVFDSGRVYKIKQLELLNSCLKEPESGGKAYTIEKLLESTYKVHIPYEQAMAIMGHEQRQNLFSLYKASLKYIEFHRDHFSLLPKFNTTRAIKLERHRYQAINIFKYYFSSLTGFVIFTLAHDLFFVTGLTTIQFGTYNLVWFSLCMLMCLVFGVFAFRCLTDGSSVIQAKKFVEYFERQQPKQKVIWAY
ncbi:hypothetical protein AB6C74_07710 [Vibrio splendidus]